MVGATAPSPDAEDGQAAAAGTSREAATAEDGPGTVTSPAAALASNLSREGDSGSVRVEIREYLEVSLLLERAAQILRIKLVVVI